MTTTWAEIFAPVMGEGREPRLGQAMLGQAIIDAIEHKHSLAAQASTGTGKSFAALVPMINAIQQAKKVGKTYRGVISTETLTLQNQIFQKDLPFLATLYDGFEYRKLMGRSNYLCFEVADQATIGDRYMNSIVEKLKARQSNLGDGEQSDVERVLGREIDAETWSKIASSSQFCADNQCSGEKCYSTRARALALKADLVVVNHAILATDIEMKGSALQDGPMADGLLGHVNCLVVDEGHQLEPVLVSQWTKELTERELTTMAGSMSEGIDLAQTVVSNHTIGYVVSKTIDDIQDLLESTKTYYSLLQESMGSEWKDSSQALSRKSVFGNPSAAIAAAMTEFNVENPQRLIRAESALESAIKYLEPALEEARENKVKGKRKISKGLRATKDLLDIIRIMSKALETTDGIINQYGTYGALVDGWVRRDGSKGLTIRLVPLDVSQKAKEIWSGVQTNILLSATLTDLTDGTFNYAKACVAFPPGKEINVDTPFSLQTQQLIYVTKAEGKQVEGARYDFDELMNLLLVSKGRALVLFTSRKELDWAAEKLRMLQNLGHFPYTIYVQEKDSNKAKLMESFKEDTHSVLLATKSFFVGIDVPGESLSLVALVKFPLPRYSAECRQQIAHWKRRGFSRWYEREALTIFQQASGRLIRSSGCKGVVALLDFRAMDTSNSVYKTARLGVDSLGSPVTQEIEEVQRFLTA